MSTTKSVKVKLEINKSFKVNVESYSSADEVVTDCDRRELRIADYTMEGKKYDLDWHGVTSYQQALDYLRFGYQPTVEKLKNAVKFSKVGAGKRIAFENNVYGFAPVVPLAMKGIPNSMINMTVRPIKAKVLDVYYDIGVNCHVTSEEVVLAGQKLLGTILELERQGYRFNLYALQGYTDANGADLLCVKVKSSDKPIDMKRMSFPLTHPAFFRVIGFDWQSKSPVAEYRGYGRGRALTSKISNSDAKSFAEQVFGKNSVYIACNRIDEHKDDENYIKEVLIDDKNKR